MSQAYSRLPGVSSEAATWLRLYHIGKTQIWGDSRMSRRRCTSVERNYNFTERETIAVIYSLEHFRDMTLGYNIRVWTDHTAIHFFSNTRISEIGKSGGSLYLNLTRSHLNKYPGLKSMQLTLSLEILTLLQVDASPLTN